MMAIMIQPTSFLIKFEAAERLLTREQLQRAPESLLSAYLLSDSGHAEHGAHSRGSVPDLSAWKDGSKELFQVATRPFMF